MCEMPMTTTWWFCNLRGPPLNGHRGLDIFRIELFEERYWKAAFFCDVPRPCTGLPLSLAVRARVDDPKLPVASEQS